MVLITAHADVVGVIKQGIDAMLDQGTNTVSMVFVSEDFRVTNKGLFTNQLFGFYLMFGFPTQSTAGLIMMAGGIPPLLAVYWLRNDRDQPAVLWFQRAMVCGMVWSVSFGLLALVKTPQLRFVVTNVLVLTIPTATVCYFIFCYEFTFKTKPPRVVFGLFVPPILLFVATWFNPEHLVYTMADPHLTDEILIPANEGSIRPLVTVGMGYTLVMMAAGMVFGELLRSTQRARKRQAAVILISMLIVSVLGAVKVRGVVPPYFDPTPIGWTLSGLLFVAMISRHQFLQQSPAPLEQTLATIPDGVLVLDADSVVADVNTRATEIFDISVGMTGEELRDRNPALSTVLEDTESATIEVQDHGQTRVFDSHSSTLEYGRGATGTVISLQEVTEREAAEQALEMTKERYGRIFQQSSDYVTIVDESKTVLDVTQGVEQILGYEPEAIIGRKVFNYVHPEDKQRAVEAFSEVVANPDRQLNVEFRVQATNGEYRWLEGRGSNHLEDPLINGVLVNVRDISDRKERERELEALTTRLELALEGTDTGVWEWNLSTDEIVWDEACEQLFGLDPGDFPGTYEGFTRYVTDDDLPAVEQAVDEAIETGQQYQVDFCIERPDDGQRWVQGRGIIEYDEEGNAERMLGIQTDITDRKEAERALKETKERYSRMFELSADYVAIVDETETMIDTTQGIERALGYEPEEMIGQKVLPFVHPDDKEHAFKAFADVLANPKSELDVEYRALAADGSYQWIEARGRNLLDDPLIEGVLVNVRDISTRKQREQELAETTTQLRYKNKQLERLAGIVSHDLQTPLSTAEKLTLLLRADLGEVDPAVEQSLADLEATHQRLREFADHLPRLARESTDVEGATTCDLQTIAESAWGVVETGSLDLQIESSCRLSADSSRLQRVFENLFQNTVTHGVEAVDGDSEAATTVSVGSTDDGFYIEDDGPGILPEQRSELFEYGMGTGSGSGFGLAIVRTIVEAHGWTVRVVDGDSGGARFEVETNQ